MHTQQKTPEPCEKPGSNADFQVSGLILESVNGDATTASPHQRRALDLSLFLTMKVDAIITKGALILFVMALARSGQFLGRVVIGLTYNSPLQPRLSTSFGKKVLNPLKSGWIVRAHHADIDTAHKSLLDILL